MSYVRRLVTDDDLKQPWEKDKKISKGTPTFTLEGATPQYCLAYPGQQTAVIRLPAAGRLEHYDVGKGESLGYLARFKVGQRIPMAHLRQYSEVSFTANAVVDLEHVPLSGGIPVDMKLRIFLKADVYNNGGYTTQVRAYFSDATAIVETTSTSYVTLSTVVDVPTPNVDDDFALDVVVAGGTAFVKNVTALVLGEFK